MITPEWVDVLVNVSSGLFAGLAGAAALRARAPERRNPAARALGSEVAPGDHVIERPDGGRIYAGSLADAKALWRANPGSVWTDPDGRVAK